MIFINQSANFSRQKRFVLDVLFNIICWSMFLLSTLYEGVITSSMIEPAHENRMKTLDDVLGSNYEILIDLLFESKIKNVEAFEAVKSRIKMVQQLSVEQYKAEIQNQHFVIIRNCENAYHEMNIEVTNGHPVSNFYYLLPEKILGYYIQLEASYLNPYLERLQWFMDLSFQAGLPQIWDVYSSKGFTRSPLKEEERQMLKLEDFHQIFILGAAGLTLAGHVLLIEIFYHGCLRNIRLSSVLIQLRRLIYRLMYRKRSLNVKKNFVKP